MTKDMYYEMCEMLGSEPVDSEIPVEFTDLPLDVQEAYSIYARLQDIWDYMSGAYVGKNFSGFFDLLDVMGVEDKRTVSSIINTLDNIRRDIINTKSKNPPAQSA